MIKVLILIAVIIFCMIILSAGGIGILILLLHDLNKEYEWDDIDEVLDKLLQDYENKENINIDC